MRRRGGKISIDRHVAQRRAPGPGRLRSGEEPAQPVRGPHDHDHFILSHFQVDALQHVQRTEMLVDLFGFDDDIAVVQLRFRGDVVSH